MRQKKMLTRLAAAWLAVGAVAGLGVLNGPRQADAAPPSGPAAGSAVRISAQRARPVAAAADPAVIAVAGSTRSGSSTSIRLISPRTGNVLKVLAPVGTGNGFALSPDGKEVFVVGLVRTAIEIRQISAASGAITEVARGAYPAVSPDSGDLAYATGAQFTELAIRNLRTGSTRVINLALLLGKGATLLNLGTVTWLGDGQVLAVPGFEAVGSGSSGARPRSPGTRRAPAAGGLRAVVVTVTPRRLTARRIAVPRRWSRYATVISGDASGPGSFLIARTGVNSPEPVDLITLHGSGVTARQVATLPRGALPVAFAPDGDRVLYLVGHAPPALWVGTIKDGKLTATHRLFTDGRQFGLDAAAW